MEHFIAHLGLRSYEELYHFSISEKEKFWQALITYFEIDFTGSLDCPKVNYFLEYTWFPEMKLNFAENLLKKGRDQDVAGHFFHESGIEQKMTYKELRSEVARIQNYLKEIISVGDVVACYMPNTLETLITMLATTSLGGIFTSTSCDFGVPGVVDRFSQSKPKVLVGASSYMYNGKVFDQRNNIYEIVKQVPSIQNIIEVNFLKNEIFLESQNSVRFENIQVSDSDLFFVKTPFASPLYIMYSSGTTGKPKCIVHSVGGTLLQHVKELALHCDLTQEKSIFFFTTCGWMMWNWLMSSLFFGSVVGLYEGSPAYPSAIDFMGKLSDLRFNIVGTSPKFLKALELAGYNNHFSFPELKTLLSTGSPLLDENFDFVYEKIKQDVHLASISGGTDILGCFMLGNPMKKVERGFIQGAGLAMDIAAFSDDGKSLIGEKGELVCLQPFPSMPLGFLNDPHQDKIKDAYFHKFENIWCHGDFIEIQPNGSVKVFGRSDATLNPGGVRIGTAEIYHQVEKCSFVQDCLCVGRSHDGDVDIYLFVITTSDTLLDDDKIKQIKKCIRENTTPRHVPKFIYQVKEIPYTRSGKKMELVITHLLAGLEIKNKEAMMNPWSLAEYEKFQ